MNEAGADGADGGGGGEAGDSAATDVGDGGGNVAPHWSEGALPAELAGAAFVKESDSLEAFAKKAVDAHNYATGSLRVPTEHASAEDRAAFRERLREHVPTLVDIDPEDPSTIAAAHRALGQPEDPASYNVPDLDVGEHAPPALDSQIDFFRGVAHRHGLTDAQFQGVLKEVTEQGARTRMSLAEQSAEQMGELKAEWGSAYDSKVAGAKAAATATHAPPALIEAIDKGTVGAESLRWLASLHDALAGGGSLEGLKDTARGNTGEITPSEASAQLAEIQNNPEHPYWKAAHPKHAWAVREYGRLTAISLGEDARTPHSLDQHVEMDEVSAFEGRV